MKLVPAVAITRSNIVGVVGIHSLDQGQSVFVLDGHSTAVLCAIALLQSYTLPHCNLTTRAGKGIQEFSSSTQPHKIAPDTNGGVAHLLFDPFTLNLFLTIFETMTPAIISPVYSTTQNHMIAPFSHSIYSDR